MRWLRTAVRVALVSAALACQPASELSQAYTVSAFSFSDTCSPKRDVGLLGESRGTFSNEGLSLWIPGDLPRAAHEGSVYVGRGGWSTGPLHLPETVIAHLGVESCVIEHALHLSEVEGGLKATSIQRWARGSSCYDSLWSLLGGPDGDCTATRELHFTEKATCQAPCKAPEDGGDYCMCPVPL